MDHSLQIWIIVISAVLILSVGIEIFVLVVFVKLLTALRPVPGRRSLQEIADKAYQTLDSVDKTAKSMDQILIQVKPTIDQATSISQRQLTHADQVVGDMLTGVERLNTVVSAVSNLPSRAMSAGVRIAMAALLHYRNKNRS